jgi:hypothetical protein
VKKTEQKACRGERMLLHHNFSIGPFKTESRLKSWQGSKAVQPDRARPVMLVLIGSARPRSQIRRALRNVGVRSHWLECGRYRR